MTTLQTPLDWFTIDEVSDAQPTPQAPPQQSFNLGPSDSLSLAQVQEMYNEIAEAKSWAKSGYQELQFKEPEVMKLQPKILYPYNDHSKGGKALAAELGFQFVKKNDFAIALANSQEGQFTVINWGNWNKISSLGTAKFKVINDGELVHICSDKVKFFEKVKGNVRIPEYTLEISEALRWVEEGHQVMGRRARGSCGSDIVFYEDDLKRFSDSEFWVKYKKKKAEYRIHLAFGKIIAVQQKALRTTDLEGNKIDTSTVDYRIRNLSHGFIFKRHDIAPPTDVMDQAAAAIAAVGLDFGAVDVIYNETEKKAYVLEVNTAPGLEGTTVLDYAAAFKEHLA